MARKPEKKGLGRGLSAFLADVEPEAEQASSNTPSSAQTLPIQQIEPNPEQPRRSFDDRALHELKSSIAEKGILQPLLVRPHPSKDNVWQIVAGERRWRAAQLAQVHTVPVTIMEMSDADMFEMALIENVQRADLSPMEEANGYQLLIDRFGHTQEALSKSLGKSRSHIANTLRLLAASKFIRELLERGELSAGHARACLPAADPDFVAAMVIAQGYSVRQTEAYVRELNEKAASAAGQVQPKSGRSGSTKDADTRALEGDLTAHLRLKVAIDHKASGAGELRIKYTNLDELDGLCQLLSR
ncbi:MAG: ParB/RepB/Spo0J family partition protein [Pseudomonadota bacterium]